MTGTQSVLKMSTVFRGHRLENQLLRYVIFYILKVVGGGVERARK